MQYSLLPVPETEVLVNDDSGKIVYRRSLFTHEQAQAWFEQLREHVDWHSQRRPMYDRVVDVPRLMASYALDGTGVPQPIHVMRPDVERFCGVVFTSAGLNLYRDGNDSVAPHGDHVERGPKGAPVALVSLGAERRMTIRTRAKPRRVIDRDLETGSLLVMDYASHLHWEHGIPKTKEHVGQRISVAFRITFPQDERAEQSKASH